jgi:ribosomal protein L37AE/L43A
VSRFSSTVKSGSRVSNWGTTPSRARTSRSCSGIDIPSTRTDPASIGCKAEKHAQRRRLAGAIGAEQSEELAGRDGQVDAVHHRDSRCRPCAVPSSQWRAQSGVWSMQRCRAGRSRGHGVHCLSEGFWDIGWIAHHCTGGGRGHWAGSSIRDRQPGIIIPGASRSGGDGMDPGTGFS